MRTPGAEIHIDPHPSAGYLRAVTGDLAFTTNEWRGSDQPPEDTVAPVISDVTARQAAVTVATEGEAPIFTPNRDELSDTITIRHTLSEPAFIDIRVFRLSNDKVVRRMNGWSRVGPLADRLGRHATTPATSCPRAGIASSSRRATGPATSASRGPSTVKVLSAMKRPRVAPDFFFAEDDDALARTATFRTQLTKPGRVTIVVRDASGTVIRTGLDGRRFDAGRVKWAWDGKDDAGAYVERGVYTGRARIARPQGTYAHDVDVLISPFVLDPSDRTVTRGQTLTLLLTSAEPLEGKPTLTVKQPGLEERPLRKIRRLSATTFRVRYYVSRRWGHRQRPRDRDRDRRRRRHPDAEAARDDDRDDRRVGRAPARGASIDWARRCPSLRPSRSIPSRRPT